MYSKISLTRLLESDKSPDIVPIRTDRDLWAKELLWDLLQLQKSDNQQITGRSYRSKQGSNQKHLSG
jgi:hypothetical protein